MSKETINKEGISRREFLGLASLWTTIVSFLTVLAGTFRMTKASVHYEESLEFRIGKADEFPVGTLKKLDDKNVFIFSDSDGLHAISSVCTHLGCVVSATDWGFQCPCHGSKFNKQGKVIGGPAPRPLQWYKISKHVDGNLVVDRGKEVAIGTKYGIA